MLFWGKASSTPALQSAHHEPVHNKHDSWTRHDPTLQSSHHEPIYTIHHFGKKLKPPVQLNIVHNIPIIHIMNIIHHFGKSIIRQCSQTIFSEKIPSTQYLFYSNLVTLWLIILLGPDILHSNSEHKENLFTLSILGKASTRNEPNHKKERFVLCWRLPYKKCSCLLLFHITKQGRIHGYPGRVQVGRDRIWVHFIIWAGTVKLKTAKTQKK